MRPAFPGLPLLALLIAGCGDGYLHEAAGPYGLRFSEDGDCVQIDVSGVDLAPPYTVDVYLRASVTPVYAIHPVVVWPGAFAVYETADGELVAGSSDVNDARRAIAPASLTEDDGVHHLAATFDTSGNAVVFLDGTAMTTPTPVPAQDPGTRLYVGCWPGQADARFFEGDIGEVRLTGTLSWTGAFEPEWTESAVTEDTLGLWHLDEGRGTAALDAMETSTGEISGAAWVDFPLEGIPVDPLPED